jgi:glycosyltransferase involved in cell wall biosynthesis
MLNLNENRIIIVTTFHNVEDYIVECLNSITNQKYDNWKCILIDNNSTDNTRYGIETYLNSLKNDLRAHFIYHRLNERKSPLYCDIYAIDNFVDSNDICAVVCGDDKLLGDYALSIINQIYLDNQNILLTHGDYISSYDDKRGQQFKYTDIRWSQLRKLYPSSLPLHDTDNHGYAFGASHLKTFRGILFKELKKQDYEFKCFKTNDNEWIQESADVYYITPMLEIAGQHNVYYNEIPIYWWRKHDNNEATPNYDLLNSKQPFKQIF